MMAWGGKRGKTLIWPQELIRDRYGPPADTLMLWLLATGSAKKKPQAGGRNPGAQENNTTTLTVFSGPTVRLEAVAGLRRLALEVRLD